MGLIGRHSLAGAWAGLVGSPIMSEAEPVSGTVFISDDDDDLDAPEDEWLNDGFTVSGA